MLLDCSVMVAKAAFLVGLMEAEADDDEDGEDECYSCPCPCSDSPYGRVIYTKPGWDIRLYTPVPRGTALYRKIYRNRTCTERVNNRVLNDYGLHSLVVHSARRYSFIIMVIGICIHLDARYKQKHPCLKGS